MTLDQALAVAATVPLAHRIGGQAVPAAAARALIDPGRALAFATGVKLSKPELTLLVPMGDGDALAIGGNHFIHAARRNIDITAIVMNNRIYGMTGGQFSPLSGPGILATTAPSRTIDNFFDVVELAKAAGASFVARSTTCHCTGSVSWNSSIITTR